jgi:class 3 adenylate cyclase
MKHYIREALLVPEVKPAVPKKDITSALTKKWSLLFYRQLQAGLRKQKKLSLTRIRNITNGLKMPDITSVPIGGAKSMEAAVLFFDLEGFTNTSSRIRNEETLYMLNSIIPHMMTIVTRWKGEVEKNTGDGIMAIFGTETRNSFVIARDAIEAAMVMRYLMVNDIAPKLDHDGVPVLNFRIGIDMGNVLLSRIGTKGKNFLTVVGAAANRASQLQSLALSNGICIGDNLLHNLHSMVQRTARRGTSTEWTWQYESDKSRYEYYHFHGEFPEPKEWAKVRIPRK